MMSKILLEDDEAIILGNWLRIQKYTFSHVANEAGQKGTHNIIRMMSKKKKMGVSKGFPDFVIILKRGSLLFIELKRAKKGLSKVSKEQEEWIQKLNTIENVSAEVCYGAQEAIQFIQEMEEF